jgi:8-oxo-dGTP pyrophosphatase MutT (NUDIX family)
MSEKKKKSAGVIITDGRSLILGHTTGTKRWDIPKGGIEGGETPLEGAIRELIEETGLIATENDLKYLGTFDYSPKKDLILYLWMVEKMPNPDQMICTSIWNKGEDGPCQPELDSFAKCEWKFVKNFVNDNLYKVLCEVKTMIGCE